MMRLFLITCLLLVVSCKSEKKEEAKETAKEEIVVEPVEEKVEPVKEEEKLPPNTVKVNEEDISVEGIGININNIHCLDKGNNEFLLKIFFNNDAIEKYADGKHSFFMQLYPFEDDVELLDEKNKAKKHLPISVSLKSLKKAKEGFVLFKAFKSDISSFEKIVLGIYDVGGKQDVFRTELEDIILKEE